MTTLQQTQPPILCYEVWENEGLLRGRIVDEYPYWKAVRYFDYHYEIKGRQATYIIVSHQGQIGRKEAIAFATAIFKGAYSRKVVDLSPCQPKRSG